MAFTKPFREEPKKEAPKKSEAEEALWENARNSAIGQSGGFAGVPKDKRDEQIQKHYDQLVENDKQVKAWAGHGKGEPTVLGDV